MVVVMAMMMMPVPSHPGEGEAERTAARRAAMLLLRLHDTFRLDGLPRLRLTERGRGGNQRDRGGRDQSKFLHRRISFS